MIDEVDETLGSLWYFIYIKLALYKFRRFAHVVCGFFREMFPRLVVSFKHGIVIPMSEWFNGTITN